MPQAEIDALLVEHGRAGRAVVRLKGGDPFVFGRGGEEAEALREAGIPFEVVPGVTAGVAASAYAGIPVTHREAASAVAFVTGHEDPRKPESALDWGALAAFPGTVVVYMGVRRLPAITERLIAGGRNRGGAGGGDRARDACPRSGSWTGTLATIAEVASAEQVRAPALAVFGAVAALRERLAWFEARALSGVTVAVTRARAQASGLAATLRSLGAEVVEAPAIRIVPLDGPLPDVAGYDLVCLTSPNGVRLLFSRLLAAGRDARALAGARVAAIGPGTAAALREHGVIADVVPERFVAEGLVEALADVPVKRALVARAADARDVLPDALRARGAEVDVVRAVRDGGRVAQRVPARGGGRGGLRDLHLLLDRALLPRRGRPPRGAPGQHRPGDERDAARARARAGRGGRAPRHRRCRGGPNSRRKR